MIQELYKLYKESYLVDTDTRNIRSGSLFFALKGENFNGNKFAKDALDKGARHCIIDEEEYTIEGKTVLVENVLETLQELAKFHRKHLVIPVIGLTGSNGKTTTKELINSVLSTQYKTYATKGNLNNHIGVPLSILSITPDVEIAIIEMGANHQKEIEFLSSISLPDYGYITNFGKAHIEGFGGVEGVIKGKSELYQNIRNRSKKVFVNIQDTKQMELTSDLNRIIFNPLDVEIVSEDPFLELEFKGIKFKTNLIGGYNVMNIAVAISIGSHFDVSLEISTQAIANYVPTNNRSQLIQKDKNTIYLDAYNANPSSVTAALKSFSKQEAKNKTLVLGDMFELGSDSLQEHQKINDLIVELGFENVFLVGEYYSKIQTTFHQFTSTSKFIDYLKINEFKQATFLIKGSRGMTLEKVVDYIN